MNRTCSLVIGLALTVATGCGKDDKAAGEPAEKASKPSAQTAEAAPPAPFTGKLTIARVMGVKDAVKPFDPWAKAMPLLESKLGKPTAVDGQTYRWGVVEGDKCAFFAVDKDNEKNFFKDKPDPVDMIGAVSQPVEANKDDGNWKDCAKAAGMKLEPAEDPDAPGPPKDGASVTVTQLRDGVAKAKSKWVGAKVEVEGLYVNATTTTSGDEKTVRLTISAAKGDLKNTIGCKLGPDGKMPKMPQWTKVSATGIVVGVFGGSLDECEMRLD